MLFKSSHDSGGRLVEIRHQIPGRTRLRVPALVKSPDLEAQIAVALGALDGVQGVRPNPSCASFVLHHRPDVRPSRETLANVLRPILMPSMPSAPSPAPSHARRRPVQPSTSGRGARAAGLRPGSCPICRLKLEAARWILSDVWRCWREHWTQRLRARLVASFALFRP